MSVVVSDPSPLHYLLLCGAESILPHLRQTNARLDPKLYRAAFAREQAHQQER